MIAMKTVFMSDSESFIENHMKLELATLLELDGTLLGSFSYKCSYIVVRLQLLFTTGWNFKALVLPTA